MEPEIGSIWTGQGFKIQVIDKNDPKNINTDRTYKRSGMIVYEYLTQPIGKIGNCKTIKGFHQCWG
tara:strand:+ start:672 stop:869 length:198 start_codon:yes stop_codon:yes gene_type:complete